MAALAHQEARPRTTGEILDDAWRLYRADAPLLLAASGLFLVPAVAVLLVLLTQPFPQPTWLRAVWPALAALLLPLTGLGAGACEEAFHLRTEGERVSLSRCLRAAWRRGLNHLAIEALLLLLPMLALLCLVSGMPPAARWLLALILLLLNAPVWLFGLTRHAVLTAGQKNLWRAWRLARRATGRHAGKAVLLAAARLVLLLLAVINLYLFLRFGLSLGEDLAGLDTAFVRLLLSPRNPVFLLVLTALAWWLLAPYNEAANYLFLVDARTRYEGLDLWYQIEQLFPVSRAGKVGAVLLAVGGLLLAAGPARAGGGRLGTVRQARKDVAAILKEAESTQPYPGGKHWQEPLREVGARLDPEGDAGRGRYRWFFQAADKLGQGDRAADLKLLRDLDARLGVVEESLTWQPRRAGGAAGQRAPPADDIRRLVPPGQKSLLPEKEEKKPPVEKDRPHPQDFGPQPARPMPGAGIGGGLGALGSALGYFCLFTCLVLLGAVVVVGVVLLVRNWHRNRKRAGAAEQGALPQSAVDYLEEPDKQNVASLWRHSDELARAGRFLEAVRTLYLAVLALLHQGGLIRYERTRTNGEYADHLRRQGSGVHRPFLGLTGLFELKWYGERACQAGDYQTCRGLAETIQTGARGQRTEDRGQKAPP
jgi:hypothetical protein